MSVLDEVKQKRDYAQSRKDAGEQGYDPAIEFYNRIIVEMEESQKVIKWLEDFHTFSPINEAYGDFGINLAERCSEGWILDNELLKANNKESVDYISLRDAVIAGINLTK